MPLPLRVVRVFVIALAVSRCASAQATSSRDCQLLAAPPPLATLGGPATAGRGQTEVGIGAGAFGYLFGSVCAIDALAESNWFARWRRGISDGTDLGFDAQISSQGNGTLTGVAKIAARQQVTRGLRLEEGVGAADSGSGRSVNGEVAATIGTWKHPENTWNYYASLRLAGSHGCFNLLCAGGEGAPGTRAPGAIIPVGEIGATARVSETARFVMEGGLGGFFTREQPNSGGYVHIAFGVQFVVGRTWKSGQGANTP